MGDPPNEVDEFADGLTDEDRARLEEQAAYENAQSRFSAAQIVGAMPDFWRARFEKVVRQHGACRRGRRATAALLREYGSWFARTAQLRAKQAAEKAERAEKLVVRVANREIFGKGLPRGATPDHVTAAEQLQAPTSA
jgi:hypothetical protein